jgi:hypothetical protein
MGQTRKVLDKFFDFQSQCFKGTCLYKQEGLLGGFIIVADLDFSEGEVAIFAGFEEGQA